MFRSQFVTRFGISCLLSTSAAALALAPAAPAWAQTASAASQRSFDIPALPLNEALRLFMQQSGIQISYTSGDGANVRTNAVKGNHAPAAALSQLLAGTGLTYRFTAPTSAILEPAPTPNAGAVQLGPVRVESDAASSGSGRYAGVVETAAGPVDGYIAKRSATATKNDTPIIETPQSVSVVTADRIEAIGANRLGDALAYTPGIKAINGYDSRYDWVMLRGFDAYSPGFYLDGLQLRNSANYAVWRIETYGAERVELLRGPASVLYGQNGPGGVINVVSKRPVTEPLHEIQAQVGNLSRFQLAGDFGGPIGKDDKWTYRLTGLALDSDTQVNHVSDDRIFVAPAVTWRPSADTSLTVLGHYQRLRSGTSSVFLPLEGTLLPNPNGPIRASTFTGEPDFDRFNQNQWTIGYLFEHHMGETWTVRQNARYGELKSDFRQVYGTSFLSVDPATPDGPANFRVLDRYAFGSYEKDRTFTIDNQIQANLGSGRWRNTILLGFDYQRGKFDVATFFGAAPSLDIYKPVYGQSVVQADPYIDSATTLTQSGLYGQLQSKLDDHWVLTLGGRYDWARVRTNDHLAVSIASQRDGKFSGRAGLVYLSTTGLAPYVSYSESFSPITTINPDTSRPFRPETGQQIEGGLRYQPPGRKDSYSVAVFELRRQNFVSFDTSFQPRQTGEVRVKGVELEALVQPTPDMNVTAAYSWTPKADVTSSSRPGEIGKQMQAVPEHQLSLWTDYRFGFGLKLGAGARYTGSTRGYGESAPVKVPGYTLFDAMLGYDFGLWRVAVNARNLTNKYYFGSNCDSYGCGAGETRRIVGTLTYRW